MPHTGTSRFEGGMVLSMERSEAKHVAAEGPGDRSGQSPLTGKGPCEEDGILETSASFGQTISYDEGAVSLSEVISALTFALDLTDGAVPGHSLRTCVIGMRLASALEIPAHELTGLYYALLLKDICCADTATRLSHIMGSNGNGPWSLGGLDDLSTNPMLLERIWREVLPEVPLPDRIGRMLGSSFGGDRDREREREVQSSRSGSIMRNLGMSSLTIEAVTHVDERWDGSGLPLSLAGDVIPRLSRICSVAQTLDAFATEFGTETALKMVRSRRGKWFDPEIVRAAQSLHTSGRLWKECQPGDVEETRAEVLRQDPGFSTPLTPERVDRICEAFGNVVDAKSPFTFHHSVGVTEVAISLAQELQLPSERVSLVRRAAFLHDIGKLAVPNRILDKRGRLTPQEWAVVTRHPALSGSILRRVGAFRELAVLAAEHHERLDGSGYPYHLQGDQISMESRIIAMADCYAAMAEDRPYRRGLDSADILQILARDVPHKLDETCFAALTSAIDRWGSNMPISTPALPAPKRSRARNPSSLTVDILLGDC
jgi:putative nucleotidyltransferase with HDIG domain